jgi:hypothetical protein
MVKIVTATVARILMVCLLPAISHSETIPRGIEFLTDTLHREASSGDNWCITWGADDQQYAAMCDGRGWDPEAPFYRTRTYRIKGDVDGFSVDMLDNFPLSGDGTPWFGYGLCAVDGTLYHFISQTPKNHWSGPFLGTKLIYSPDNGESWFRHDAADVSGKKLSTTPGSMFFWQEDARTVHGETACVFSTLSFAQMGRNNGRARDDFVYVYSPDGPYTHHLNMARVPRDTVTERGAYEFFSRRNSDGSAEWTKRIEDRGIVHTFPQKTGTDCFGWYSWLPSVVWNEGLGLFIMVTGGTYTGNTLDMSEYYHGWMHTKTGSLALYHAENPWGPWHRFFYDPYWTVDSDDNRTYQPKLSPKWISEDGRDMVLIWSDAMKNSEGRSHTVNYRWNHMKVRILTE